MLKTLKTIPVLIFTFTSCLPLGDDGINSFIKESWATVSDSYQVTIMDYNNKFDKRKVGNTFTVDTDHNKAPLDSTSINFNWLSNDTLQIDYDKRLRTFIQEKNVQGVTIIYQAR